MLWNALKVIVLSIVVGMVLVSAGLAAPKMRTHHDCAMASDMALVAMSLAVAKVDLPVAAAVMDLVYDTSESEAGTKVKAIILRTTYGMRESGTAPGNFAKELLMHCIRSGGDLDGVLGKES